MLPRIVPADSGLGFRWALPTGEVTKLQDLFDLPDAEPHRWLPTHLEAIDELSIEITGRFGTALSTGHATSSAEQAGLNGVYTELDRSVSEYADALAAYNKKGAITLRSGQIIGTAALLGILARSALGLAGPAPFDGDLDPTPTGIIGGRAGLHQVDAAHPWRGARWLVITDAGERLPASLAMLLSDSSGVDKEATLREHREALQALIDGKDDAPTHETRPAAGAVDWLLFDWIMAHREAEDSPAVTVATIPDARLIIDAAAASLHLRRRIT
ncbi:MAG: hypothetical protein Q4G67_12200 [Actinomycetia bacterium]|nr:hypothetical protein [Actinomycetes bacterium]